jgi:small subunit ribosomal protein S1
MILDIDNEKRRVSLGIKQCKDNPWQSFAENNSIGDKIIGKIKSITDFGIFVELDGEIDGLIHISDISWNDEDNIDLSQFKKSDEIETSILSIEANRQRISLGIKQLNTDVFLEFNQSNPRGSIIKGIVSEVDERNAVILINKEIKGILNISEVSRDKVEDMRTIFKQNDEIEAKIIGSDRKSRTLKLSIKAKEEKEEREAIDSYKADEKKSISKTSLGELLKSKFKKD